MAGDDRFAAGFTYLLEVFDPNSCTNQRIKRLPVGASARIELTGGSFAIEQVYVSKSRAECFFESHRKYIDVQVIVEGREAMEVAEIGRLTVAEPYFEPRDFIKYADTSSTSSLRILAGDVAVFFPLDGHMPCLQLDRPILVRKTVVKVPVDQK